MAARKAASVFPEPVGAASSTSRPAAMAGHACACAGVGAGKAPLNQAHTTGWKVEIACIDCFIWSLRDFAQSKPTERFADSKDQVQPGVGSFQPKRCESRGGLRRSEAGRYSRV